MKVGPRNWKIPKWVVCKGVRVGRSRGLGKKAKWLRMKPRVLKGSRVDVNN